MKFFKAIGSFFARLFSSPKAEAPAPTTPTKPSAPIVGDRPYASWPNQDWARYAEGQVIAHGLHLLTPKDWKDFWPKGGPTIRNWVHLLAAMVKHESGFKPAKEYRENFKNGAGETTISTGLFQLSYHTQRSVYGFKEATTEMLKDPRYNIRCAVHILARWVKQDGVIAGGSSGAWRGSSRYWAVMRTPKVNTQVKPSLKVWAE